MNICACMVIIEKGSCLYIARYCLLDSEKLYFMPVITTSSSCHGALGIHNLVNYGRFTFHLIISSIFLLHVFRLQHNDVQCTYDAY